MGAIVLVHGAWGVPKVWDAVADGLRGRGHEVRAPELHRGSLAADTAAVQSEIDALGAPAVLCGWSYGGAVITGLDPASCSHLVYLAAMMPDEGESVLGIATAVQTRLGELIRPADDDTLWIGDDGALIDAALWADAAPDDAAAARAALRPQAAAPMTESPSRVAWREVPSTYVVCARDEALAPEIQRRQSARATKVVEWDCSHSPMLSRPGDLVDLLDELAGPV